MASVQASVGVPARCGGRGLVWVRGAAVARRSCAAVCGLSAGGAALLCGVVPFSAVDPSQSNNQEAKLRAEATRVQCAFVSLFK